MTLTYVYDMLLHQCLEKKGNIFETYARQIKVEFNVLINSLLKVRMKSSKY